MKKPVILLCGSPVAAVGGGPTHMRNMLASPLKDLYTLIHFESGSRGSESPAKDEGVYAMVFRVFTSPLVLSWKIMRYRPAVVHFNSALDQKAFWRDVAYLLISKLLLRRVVFQLHGGSLSELTAKRWMRRVARTIFSLPDAVVLLATAEKHDFEALGITNRLIIIPNGVDVSQYRGPVERKHSGKVRRLMYLGRLVRTKGIFEAMQAVEHLRLEPHFREIELRIAGSGPAREEIECFISDHQLAGNVKLVGPLHGQDKISFIQEADVFVFPTYHPEGLPYTILESLASGTPVITSRVAGIPDIVLDRVHGIMVNTKDPDDVVRAIRELAESPDALRKMSKRCIERAAQEYGLERLAERFGNLYESVRA